MRNQTPSLIHLALGVATFLLPTAAAAAAVQDVRPPEIVSPGETGKTVEVATACPTFSWTTVPATTSIELVVYALPEGVDAQELPAEPVLTRELPAGANSWTPATEQCLIDGQSYAWSVGARSDDKAPAWSDIRVFRVSERVERSETEEALERVLMRFLEQKRIDEETAAALREDPTPLLDSAAPSLGDGLATFNSGTLQPPDNVLIRTDLVSALPRQVPIYATTNGTDGSAAIRGEATATVSAQTWGVVGVANSDLAESAGVLGLSAGTSAANKKYGVLGVSSDTNLESAGVGGQGKTGVLGVGDTAKNGIGVIGIASDTLTVGGASLGVKVGVVGIGDEIGVQGKVSSITGVAGDFRNPAGKGLIVQGGGGAADIRMQTGLIDVVAGTLKLAPGDKFSGTFEGDGSALMGVIANNTDFLDNLDSIQFLRSDDNDSFDAGVALTINGTLAFGAAGFFDGSAMTGSGSFKLPTCTGCITGGGIDSGLDADRLDGIQSTGFARLGLSNAGTLAITDGTESTNKDTGSITTDGGIGIEKNLSVGGKVRLKTGELISNETGTEVLIEEGAGPNALMIDVRDLNGGVVLKGDNEDLGAHPGVPFTLQSEEAVGSGNKGGDLFVRAGQGGGGNSAGGGLELIAGAGTGTGPGGDIVLQPGSTGTGAPGRVKVKGTALDLNTSPTTNLAVSMIARQSSVADGTILYDPADAGVAGAPAWNISPALDLTGSAALVLPAGGISGAGSGSGLNADLLDGLSAGAFLSLPLSDDLVFDNLELLGNFIDTDLNQVIDQNPSERAVDKVISFGENITNPDPGPTVPAKMLSIDMRTAGQVKIATDTNSVASHTGATLRLIAEDAVSTGAGGELSLESGKGGVNTQGGDIDIIAGRALTDAESTGTQGRGGDVSLTAGAGGGNQRGGGVNLTGGTGDPTLTGKGGNVTLSGGNGTGAGGTGGDVILDPGTGSTTVGRVKILDSSANALSVILSGFTADRLLTMPNKDVLLGAINATAVTGDAADDQALLGTGASAASWTTISNCTGENHLTYDQSSNTFACDDDDVGSATPWEALANVADTPTAFTGDDDAETVTFDFESDFAADRFRIEQSAGNPTAGTLLDLRAVNSNVVVLRAGDGTNGIAVSQTGALAAEGTGTITATDVACAGCVADAEISTDFEEEGNINATAVTGNAADDQALLGTGAGAASWTTISNCTGENHLTYDQSSNTFACDDDDVGSATPWEALANVADTPTAFTGDDDAETVTFDFESDFAADRFRIEQSAGNPTAGTLLDLRASDSNVVVLKAGDGTNGIAVSQTGALAAEGTGTITATDVACAGCVADAEISTDFEEEGNINATAVTGNAADDRALLGTGAGAASWTTISNCTGENHLTYDQSSNTFACDDDDVGSATPWEALANVADTPTAFTGDDDAETVTFDFESDFAADRFRIEQSAGNPTAGTLLDLRAVDSNVVVLKAGDGTNGIAVSQTGALTAEGTGTITATDVACAGCVADAEISTDFEEEGNINATAVTGNAADDQALLGTGASAASWTTISNCTGENHLTYDQSSNTFACDDDDVGSATPWEALANVADTPTAFTGDDDAETVTFDFESDFAADRFRIEQSAGNPTAGTLLDLRAVDSNVVVLKAGDGTNGIAVSQTGALTAEGTGTITATGILGADGAPGDSVLVKAGDGTGGAGDGGNINLTPGVPAGSGVPGNVVIASTALLQLPVKTATPPATCILGAIYLKNNPHGSSEKDALCVCMDDTGDTVDNPTLVNVTGNAASC